MDAELHLIVPHIEDLARLGLERRVQVWQGVESEECRRTFYWGERLIVQVTEPLNDFVMARLPGIFRSGTWDHLYVKGEGLRDYETLQWGGTEPPDPDHGFEALLRRLLDDAAPWALFFFFQDDLDDTLEGDVEALITWMRANFSRGAETRGLTAFHLVQAD